MKARVCVSADPLSPSASNKRRRTHFTSTGSSRLSRPARMGERGSLGGPGPSQGEIVLKSSAHDGHLWTIHSTDCTCIPDTELHWILNSDHTKHTRPCEIVSGSHLLCSTQRLCFPALPLSQSCVCELHNKVSL